MQSLNRVLAILEAVAAGGPSNAVEVAEATGLSLSTTSRLMTQLAEAAMLDRTDPDRRYSLGPRLMALAHAADHQVDLGRLARPIMEPLRELTGETVSLHVLRGGYRVCIASSESHHQVRRVVEVGSTLPLSLGATGAVLLIDTPDAELPASGDEADSHAAGTFARALRHARESGWVVTENEDQGIVALAVPVRRARHVEAALTISGPSSRFTVAEAKRHVAAAINGANTLAQRAYSRQPGNPPA